MNVKDVLTDACILLGLEAEQSILTNTETSSQQKLEDEKIQKLFNLFKLSIREFCTNYLPQYKTEKLTATDKCISLSSLQNIIRVNNVKQNNQFIKFKYANNVIKVANDGCYEVYYSAYPKIEGLDDEINFLTTFNPDVLVLGLCAYYCIANGMYQAFTKYNDSYVTKAKNIRNIKLFTMPKRSW